MPRSVRPRYLLLAIWTSSTQHVVVQVALDAQMAYRRCVRKFVALKLCVHWINARRILTLQVSQTIVMSAGRL